MPRKEVVDAVTMKRALTRISHEIIEGDKRVQDIVLIGTKTRRIYTAQHLAERLEQLEDIDVPIGELDITLYRDDVKSMEELKLHSSDVPVSIGGKEVILVDGALYMDRTIRAVMDAVMDSSRPKKISLAVLVGRGYRELPIHADYVGRNILTSKTEETTVEVEEHDGAGRIMINKGNE